MKPLLHKYREQIAAGIAAFSDLHASVWITFTMNSKTFQLDPILSPPLINLKCWFLPASGLDKHRVMAFVVVAY